MCDVALPPSLRLVLCLYWVAASLLIIAKQRMPLLQQWFNYGKLQTCPTILAPDLRCVRFLHFLGSPRFSTPTAWNTFYAVAIATSALTICLSMYPDNMSVTTIPIPLALFLFQVIRRFTESRLVHNYSTTRQMSLVLLLSGLSFYIVAPITIFLDINTSSTLSRKQPILQSSITIPVFLLASYAQNVSHRQLANVKPIVGKYGIPTGFLFRYVVCPHYLSEIIIYCILALQTNSLCVTLVFTFVAINLTDSALRTAHWYEQTFPKSLLPKKRHAILPFIL